MTRLRTIMALAWLASTLSSTPSASLAGDIAFDDVEYKLRLVPEMLSAEGRRMLWDFVGAKSADVSQKKCRLVQFLDVEGDYVQGASFIVRHRAKLKTDACPSSIPAATPKGELTLKFRAGDAGRAAHASGEPWMKAPGKHKTERDVGFAAAGEGRLQVGRAYSASAEADGDVDVPTTVAQLRAKFPSALSPLSDGAPLKADRILEESWELEPPDASGLPEKIDLAGWYCVATNGDKKGQPLVAELSFKTKGDKPDAKARAEALINRLILTIDSAWLAPGGSKTEATAACRTQ